MIPALKNYLFANLVNSAYKLDKFSLKEKKRKVTPNKLDKVSLKNKVKINKLRTKKQKLEKLEDLYRSVKKVEHMTYHMEQINKIDSETALKYKQTIKLILAEIDRKRVTFF
ncbi:MAG: hypothetical protein AB7V77_01365 [Candidatus Woesearchaeota archaeon]